MDSRRTFLHRSVCSCKTRTRRGDTIGSARAPIGHGDWTLVGGWPWQIPAGIPTLRSGPRGGKPFWSGLTPRSSRKAASCGTDRPYRKPTQVGWEQLSQGVRATPCLGTRQIDPVPSEEGVPRLVIRRARKSLLGQLARAAGNWPKRLFTKNTGLCERGSGRIGADSCPVPDG